MGPSRWRLRLRAGAVSSATKPISRWVVSQNGLFFEWPQRQSTIELPGGSSNGTSSASMIVTGPVIFSGPFCANLNRDVGHALDSSEESRSRG